MALTKERLGEIAYTLLKAKMAKEGIHFAAMRREAGNLDARAKEAGLTSKDVMAFVEHVVYELAEETFGPKEA